MTDTKESLKEKMMKKMGLDLAEKIILNMVPISLKFEDKDGHKLNLILEQVYKSKDNRWVLVFNPIEEEQK